MPKRIGRCTNFGGCNIADSKKSIEILETQDFVCQECKSNLISADQPTGKSKKGLFIVLFILVLLGIGAFFMVTQFGAKTADVKSNAAKSKGQSIPPAPVQPAPTITEVAPQPQQNNADQTKPTSKVEEPSSKKEKKIVKKAGLRKTANKNSGNVSDDIDDETLQKNIKVLEKKLNNK